MKSAQTGPGSSRKEPGFSQLNPQQQQYSNTPNRSVSPTQAPGALANYTLPGVISYLTSEFTNLERFKIITNLEKSEMKYRIQQLTSELNSVRFVNEKQALRIKLLEEKLDQAQQVNTGDKVDSEVAKGSGSVETPISGSSSPENTPLDAPKSDMSGVDTSSPEKALQGESDPQNSVSKEAKSGQSQSGDSTKAKPENPADNGEIRPDEKVALKQTEIPHVDLEFLRNSRQKLNQSIREIVSLLEPPTGIDFLESHSGAATNSEFEDLLEDSKHFAFEPSHDDRRQSKESVFARYTLGRDDLLTGQKISFENNVKEPVETDLLESNQQAWDQVRKQAPTDESDTETVIMEEPDIIGILSNGSDKSS